MVFKRCSLPDELCQTPKQGPIEEISILERRGMSEPARLEAVRRRVREHYLKPAGNTSGSAKSSGTVMLPTSTAASCWTSTAT
jgi:hypothetical protein